MINKNIFLIILILLVVGFTFMGKTEAQKPLRYASADSVEYNKANFKSATVSNVMERSISAPKMAVSNVAYASDSMVSGIQEKKIIKNSSLEIEVKNMTKAMENINEQIRINSAYVEAYYSYDYADSMANSLQIRVPIDKLDSLIESIKKIGVIKNESFNISDSTDQFYDMESRLKNLIIRRERLRKMMENKTSKLSDILAVDKELADVQSNIENLERNMNRIDKSVNFSTLSLRIVPEIKIKEFVNSSWKFSTSINKSVNKFISFSQSFIDFILTCVIFSPFIIVPFGIGYIIYRKKRG